VHGSLRGPVPSFGGPGPLYLAVGTIGATVMPHVIYLHSALVGGRVPCCTDGVLRPARHFLLGAGLLASYAQVLRHLHTTGRTAGLEPAGDTAAAVPGATSEPGHE
jgi:Mn2+/Fe2+ NRAMP family transporter